MNIAGIKFQDIADGEGVRVGLYVSGCRRGCFNCHNKEVQNFSYGVPFSDDIIRLIIDRSNNPYICGLSILGGEPFEPENQRVLVPFLEKWHKEVTGKDVWCWTGAVLETQLLSDSPWRCEETDKLLSLIDILVDGPYIDSRRNLMLKFRGSSNQRILQLHPVLKDLTNSEREKFNPLGLE